jgi:hypothetical protein
MSVTLQQFESRPVPAQAILWDGTRKSAKKIIKWLSTLGVSAVYNDTASYASNGELIESISLSVEGSNALLMPNFWLVKQDKKDNRGLTRPFFMSFNGETFAEEFRLKA